MTRETFLASIPLFSTLDASELGDLLRLARQFSLPAGHLIFEQGAAADGMYVLEQGRVQLWARLLGDEEMAIAQVSAGGVLGEFALIDNGPRSAAAEVIEPAQGYFFSSRQFELLRADQRPAARKTMQQLRAILCERLRAASHELADSPPSFYEHTERASQAPALDPSARVSAKDLDLGALRVLPLFSRFSAPELAQLLAPLAAWKLTRGQMLYAAGDAPGSAFATVRGAVEVLAGHGRAQRRQAILGPGRLFGLVSAIDGAPRETGAAARENAIVLEIPRLELEGWLQGEGALSAVLADAVHAALIEALRATNRTLLAQSAMGRVAHRKKRTPSQRPP
jgi:CRP-like cAMP-binding protein